MSPVVAATECMPSKNANASAGLILKTNGIINAKVAAPPIPGSKPTQNPRPMPRSIKPKAFHCSTKRRPSMALSNIVPLLQFSPKHMLVKQRNVDEPGATILNDRREVNQPPSIQKGHRWVVSPSPG